MRWKGTKLAGLPIPANHRYGAGLGWSGEVRQMSAIGTEEMIGLKWQVVGFNRVRLTLSLRCTTAADNP